MQKRTTPNSRSVNTRAAHAMDIGTHVQNKKKISATHGALKMTIEIYGPRTDSRENLAGFTQVRDEVVAVLILLETVES